MAAGPKSKLSTSNKRLVYEVILKLIWTYGIQLWGSASISNFEILERFQGKVLRMITDAPWYVPNTVLPQDLQITSVKEEIHRFRARLYTHPNLIVRLKRCTMVRAEYGPPTRSSNRFS
jgi:hypothetical protein